MTWLFTWLGVVLRGVAQVVFAEQIGAGVLVLAAAALVSPWAALGALSGTLFGSLMGALLPTYTRAEWLIGLSGFNCAIIGLVWSAFVAVGEWRLPALAATLVLCLGLEWALRRLLHRWDLPPLAMPAVLALSLVAGVYLLAERPFWLPSPAPPFGTLGIALAVCCVIAAMVLQSRLAALQAVVLAAISGFFFSLLLGVELLALFGLWALTVAPASFVVHGVFLRGTQAGAVTGLVAAVLAILLWSGWTFSGLALWLPPLVAPYIIATWLALVVMRRLFQRRGDGLRSPASLLKPRFLRSPLLLSPLLQFPLLQPGLWRAAAQLLAARSQARPVLALCSAEAMTDPCPDNRTAGQPQQRLEPLADYRSGAWLKPGIPLEAYDRQHFNRSRRCRLLTWDACKHYRDRCQQLQPGPAHRALALLEQRGWLSQIVTEEVDSRLKDAGARQLLYLYGRIDLVECLECGVQLPWPPNGLWQRYDLRCQHCNGLLKPAVVAVGEAIGSLTRDQLENALDSAGSVLLVGCGADLPLPDRWLQQSRRVESGIIVTGCTDAGQWPATVGLQLPGPVDRVLSALRYCLYWQGLFKQATERLSGVIRVPQSRHDGSKPEDRKGRG